jgi:UDP-2,3-diacylglucosamine pyrophosphatase LpxH
VPDIKVAGKQKDRFGRWFDALEQLATGVKLLVVILLQCDAPIRVLKSRTMADQQQIEPSKRSNIVAIERGPRLFRTLFISDVHLGARGCQADRLLDFLRYHDAETIYLVGDIVDGWQLRSGWYWPQPHNDVVQKLLRKARKGARLVYLPGNHDEFLRDYFGTHFGGVVVTEQAIHVTADGARYVVTHGDQFDRTIERGRQFAALGDYIHMLLASANVTVNVVRKVLSLPRWSLSQWAKYKVKDALNYVQSFEQALAAEARRRRAAGVICGHVHQASIRDFPGARYVNCGDWVESCSAVVEHLDGRLEIVAWKAEFGGQAADAKITEAHAI